jgi:subtilase family serine protease
LRKLLLATALCFAALSLAAGSAAAQAQEVTFYFGLKRPEAAARKAFFAVQAPGSPTYRHFLPARAAAQRYGASGGTVRALKREGKALGLAVRVDPSRVFARVSGSVAQLERAFGVPIKRVFNNETLSYAYFAAPGHEVRLPRPMRPLVREVVASYSRTATGWRKGAGRSAAAAASQGWQEKSKRRGPAGAAAAAPSGSAGLGNTGTWLGGCEVARRTGAYSFDQVRHAYGLDAIPAGRGGSVAIVNVGEGLTAADLRANSRCFGLPPIRTTTRLADGQARPFGRATFEPQEDLALVRGMAPNLDGLTFSQTWLAPELWFLAPADVLAAPRLPDALSISYGECERRVRGPAAPPVGRAGAELMDSLLARLGLTGVSSFAAAGDFGSTCNGQPFAGVAWPASSPFLTAVGGTRLALDAANERTEEVAWNDTGWTSAAAGGGAGGGGHSFLSGRPPYQPSSLVGADPRRAVPDLSAHASMFPGWPVVLAGHWEPDGGTSAAAPLLAGAFAVLSARQATAGLPPLGPVNGLVYALRQSAPSTVFDVVSGNTNYSPKVPGHLATPSYDLASGLGVPRFDQLAAAIPPPG